MSFAEDYFDLLEDWKRLPKYQMERRIDSLVGFVLPGFLEQWLGIEVRLVIPELPMRIHSVVNPKEGEPEDNRSMNVDFYVLGSAGENLFIEFKSDSRSRRSKQDEFLVQAATAGMTVILDGIVRIRTTTVQERKYEVLLDQLRDAGLLEGNRPTPVTDAVRVLYLQPRALDGHGSEVVMTFADLADYLDRTCADEPFLSRFANSLKRWARD